MGALLAHPHQAQDAGFGGSVSAHTAGPYQYATSASFKSDGRVSFASCASLPPYRSTSRGRNAKDTSDLHSPNGARTSEAHDSLGILQVRRGMSAAVVAVPPERRRVSAQRLRPLAVPTEQRRDRPWHGTGGGRITEAISATAAALGTPGAHCIASFTNSLAGRSRADCDEIGETAGSGTLVRTGLRRLPR